MAGAQKRSVYLGALALGIGLVAIACGGSSPEPTGPVMVVYASPT